MSDLSLRSNSCIELSEIRKLDNLLKQCESVSHEDISYETEQFQLYDYCENKRKYSSTGLLSKLTNGKKLHRLCMKEPDLRPARAVASSSALQTSDDNKRRNNMIVIPPPGSAAPVRSSNNKIISPSSTFVRSNAIDDDTPGGSGDQIFKRTKPLSANNYDNRKRRKVHNCESIERPQHYATDCPPSKSESFDNQNSDWKSHYHDDDDDRRIKIRELPSKINNVDNLNSASASKNDRNFDTRSDKSDKSLSQVNSTKSRSKFSPTFLSRKASHKSETVHDSTARETLLPTVFSEKLLEPVETVGSITNFLLIFIILSFLYHFQRQVHVQLGHHQPSLRDLSLEVNKKNY